MAIRACSRCWVIVDDERTETCPECGGVLLRVSRESVPEEKAKRPTR